jgi:hypothetical protein
LTTTEPTRTDAPKVLLELLIDLLEEAVEIMGTAVIDLRESATRPPGVREVD